MENKLGNNMKSEFKLSTENGNSLQDQFLVIQIGDTHYAVKLEPIREIVIIPKITPVPESPDFVRGVIKLRNNIITLIDTRKRLGFKSLEELDKDMVDMLKEREQEHLNWVQTLAASIEKDTEFTLTTDPHSCAFGKWYDNYKTDNIGLSVYLKQFDIPHKKFHSLAIRALNERRNNGLEAARKLIDETRETDLKLMLNLFDGVKDAVRESHRELAIVVETSEGMIAISSDNVSNIFTFEEDNLQQTDMKNKNKFITGSVNHNGDVFLLLDLETLVKY